MPSDVVLPKLGMQTVEVDVTRVRVRPGDVVAAGDVLFEVESEKVELEIAAESAGTVSDVLVAEGDVVEPGRLRARIGEPA